jgi:hypothetical protein
VRVLEAERADGGELGQRAGVEDQHVRFVRLQDDGDAVVGDVGDDHRYVRVVREQGSQAECEEVLEAGDGDGDRRGCVHLPLHRQTGERG